VFHAVWEGIKKKQFAKVGAYMNMATTLFHAKEICPYQRRSAEILHAVNFPQLHNQRNHNDVIDVFGHNCDRDVVQLNDHYDLQQS
jgi:hypothetical protein